MGPILSESKYMRTALSKPEGRKTYICTITEKADEFNHLGEIKWYPPWRGYCFYPAYQTVFDTGCLGKIYDWVVELNLHHKTKTGVAT